MAKAPRPGHVKTRLQRTLAEGDVVALYRALMEDTIALARSLDGVHIGVVCPAADAAELAAWLGVDVVAQEGDGLAAGLVSAFRVFLGRGFDRVVAFNGDSPHLPAAVLADAFTLLEASDLVVGPTLDGGYYLVGAVAEHPGLFDGARLGTGSALDGLLGRARALGLRVARSDVGYDIDDGGDLERLARDLRQAPGRAPRTAAWLREWQERRPA